MSLNRSILEATSDKAKFLVSYTVEHYETYYHQVVLGKQDTLIFMDLKTFWVEGRGEQVDFVFQDAVPFEGTEEEEETFNSEPTVETIREWLAENSD